MKELNEVWRDQDDFNKQFRPNPAGDFCEQSKQTKEMLIHLMSEMDELLRCTEWKSHRKINQPPNISHVKNELTDIFKYWISLCHIWGVTPEDAIKDYWRKSLVCRQRYSEEFCQNLDGKIALVDIDGVLADFVRGFLFWVSEKYRDDPIGVNAAEMLLQKEVKWLNAESLQMTEEMFQVVKHKFRVDGGKGKLPVCPNAQEFLRYCKEDLGLKVVLLTSRPIDKYPNIYTDTIEWLSLQGFKFDYLWWAYDKREVVLSKGLRDKIRFTIDDDIKYVEKYVEMGIKSFWVKMYSLHKNPSFFHPKLTEVKDLKEVLDILKKEKENESHTAV